MAQHISVRGVVLKVSTIGESDRLCVLLTDKLGVVRAFAKGANNIKNKNFASTAQFAYGSFVLFANKDKYYIDESSFEELSIRLRDDLDAMCLAQYLCELVMELSPRESVSDSYILIMRLALHYLVKGTRSRTLIKAAAEMRLLALAGYMPDLVMCAGCGVFECEQMVFYPNSGRLMCAECAKGISERGLIMSASAVTGLRHSIYADLEKTFSFELKEPSLSQFGNAAERYILCQTDRNYKTLDIYKSLQ